MQAGEENAQCHPTAVGFSLRLIANTINLKGSRALPCPAPSFAPGDPHRPVPCHPCNGVRPHALSAPEAARNSVALVTRAHDAWLDSCFKAAFAITLVLDLLAT